ncbi:MAG: right-handed parallel beta-helix repeat-containing protein, partial [Methanomassiliicoccales archaeon]
MKFRKDISMHLKVYGNLIAVGTPGQMIHFTSNASSPQMKDWGNIWFYSSGNANIDYINVTYGNIGVYLFYASNSTVTNSSFSYNERGVKINGGPNNTVINNIFIGNKAGVQFEDSQNNTVTNNNITLSTITGIYSVNSVKNKIYHNNIIDNADQAYDDRDGNIWNDTYPSGGNYWSNWSPITPDSHNGSITPQMTGSPDGICDDPYPIDGDSIDYYPLKYPFGSAPPIDNELPTIDNVEADPNPQEVYNYVNISARVADNKQLGVVRINITDPLGG